MQKVCEACEVDNQARHAFSQNAEVGNIALELIHLDVWTTKATSIGGCHYYVSFIDDHTRKVQVYFMKHKSEVFSHFKAFKAMVAKEKAMQIKVPRSDGGGEYFLEEFSDYLKEQGIQRKYSCISIPQQNGVVERKNRQ